MAVNQWPKSPMGLDGDPLFRELMDRVTRSQQQADRALTDAANAGKGAAAALQPIANQVQEMATVQNTLVTQQAALSAAQQTLSDQQSALDTQQASLTAAVNRLNALAVVQSQTLTTGATGFTGFFTGARPQVTLVTTTGRLEVQFGGSLNSGEGYFAYSVTNVSSGATLVNRATVQAAPTQRIAILGGASFAPSGFRTAILTGLPINTSLLVVLEYYAATTAVYFFGGSILARPSP